MNIKLLAALAIAVPLFTVACSKKETPAEENTASEPVAELTSEQEAAIAAVDQPNPEAIEVEETEVDENVDDAFEPASEPVATAE